MKYLKIILWIILWVIVLSKYYKYFLWDDDDKNCERS